LRTGKTGFARPDSNQHTAVVKASKYEALSALGSASGAALTTIEKYIGPENANSVIDTIESHMKEIHGHDFELNLRELSFNVTVTLDDSAIEEIKVNAERKYPSPMYHPRFVTDEVASQKRKILNNPKKHEDKVSYELTPSLSKNYSKGLKSGFPLIFTAKNEGSVSVKQKFETSEFLVKK